MRIYRCLLLCLNLVLWLNITYAVDVVRVPFWDSAYVHLDTLDIVWDRIDTTSAVIPKADSSSTSFNPLHLSGGFWRDRLTFVVRADDGTCYLVVDNKYTASQDVDVWLSSDGSGGRDGGIVEMYLWEMPDSIALTAGTATTSEENFVYLTYNAGSPALKRHAAEDQRRETGGLIDSMAFVAKVILGEVSGDDEQVRSFITNQPSLYKDVMRSAFHTAPQHHKGIIPTVESHSFSATRGFLRNGRNYELVPAVNTDDVCLYVPVYSDSNYARWDSLDNFAEYADGDAIGVPHYFWVVIWGAISEDTTEYKLYMNIQTGTNTYLTRETAEQDKYNMLPTNIPDDYHETGFLIVGIIIHSDEVQTLEDGSTYLDLRGQPSGTRGGGGAPPTDSAQVDSWNFVLPPEIHDSLDANWPGFWNYDWLDSAAANAGWGLETTADGDDSLRVKAADLDERYHDGDIDLSSEVTGVLPEANGGTGDTDLDDILPGTNIAVANGENTVIGGDVTIGVNWVGVTLDRFNEQTAWRMFYSDALGDVTEFAIGSTGQYLKSAGAMWPPTWDTPSGLGMPAEDFNDSLESQVDFSPNTYHRIDTTTAKIPTATLADSTDGGSIRSETCKIADSCDGGAARAEVSDSTNSPFRAAAHDTLWANLEEEIGDSLDEIWSRVEYYIVNARFVHGQAGKPHDAVILSLEANDRDTCDTYLYRDSSTAADQTDTGYVNFGNLPYGVTKCDSLILKYRSSSATTTTSCIANIRLYLDGVPQWEHTTDEASVTNERLALYPNDADFDAGELVVVQIIFIGDADAWIKVVSAYLFCSG